MNAGLTIRCSLALALCLYLPTSALAQDNETEITGGFVPIGIEGDAGTGGPDASQDGGGAPDPGSDETPISGPTSPGQGGSGGASGAGEDGELELSTDGQPEHANGPLSAAPPLASNETGSAGGPAAGSASAPTDAAQGQAPRTGGAAATASEKSDAQAGDAASAPTEESSASGKAGQEKETPSVQAPVLHTAPMLASLLAAAIALLGIYLVRRRKRPKSKHMR